MARFVLVKADFLTMCYWVLQECMYNVNNKKIRLIKYLM